MRENHLWALHGYRTRCWSVGKLSVLIPNLLERQLRRNASQQNVGHGYHLHSEVAGLGDLAVARDLLSRKTVGWSAGPTIRLELVLDTVLMAVRRRRPPLRDVAPVSRSSTIDFGNTVA
jgi:putative transposase